MYSAKSASWISGLVAALATIAGIAVELSTAFAPELPSVWFIAAASLVVGAVASAVVAIAVAGGLYFARCHGLDLKYVLGIPVVSLLIIGFVVTRPMETHAVMIDLRTGNSVSNAIPLTVWAASVGVVLIPGLISYAVGRLTRQK